MRILLKNNGLSNKGLSYTYSPTFTFTYLQYLLFCKVNMHQMIALLVPKECPCL